VISDLDVHLVFVTRYRRGALEPAMLDRCEQVMRDVCGNFGATLAAFDGQDDHVHLLVGYPPKVAVSALVNSLKGVSARLLRSEFTDHVDRHSLRGHFWSPSYLAASAGGTPLPVLREYLERQRRPA
jgi:putative transposase